MSKTGSQGYKVGETVEASFLTEEWQDAVVSHIYPLSEAAARGIQNDYPGIKAGHLVLECGPADCPEDVRTLLDGYNVRKKLSISPK